MIAGSLTDRLGRKPTLILSDLFTITGPLISYFASSVQVLCLGRVLLGLGMGISMMCSQVYMSESSPIALRGQIVPFYFFVLFFGFILAHASSIVFAYQLSLMFGIGLLPNLTQLILLLTTQSESPTYLATAGKLRETSAAIERFY